MFRIYIKYEDCNSSKYIAWEVTATIFFRMLINLKNSISHGTNFKFAKKNRGDYYTLRRLKHF